MIKILFIGCVESSERLLRSLINCDSNFEIIGVITKRESKSNSDFVDLSKICITHGIDYYYVNNINDENSIDYIRSKKPDLIYCFGWSQLISKNIINIPPKGIIGFHPAELPFNRGRHPIIWSLVLGLKQTASTFFFIDEGADTGDILSQVKIPIEYSDNARKLYDKIMSVAEQQIIEFTKKFCNNTIVRISQDNTKANYWRKRTEKDGEIDWRMSAQNIYYLIRALTKPYLGAHFIYQGNKYKVWSAKVIDAPKYDNIEYGKVLKVLGYQSFIIKTGDGILSIEECDPVNLTEGEYLI